MDKDGCGDYDRDPIELHCERRGSLSRVNDQHGSGSQYSDSVTQRLHDLAASTGVQLVGNGWAHFAVEPTANDIMELGAEEVTTSAPSAESMDSADDPTLTRLLASDESVPFLHARLMVHGKGNAGKSSVIAAMRGLAFDAERKSTVGSTVASLEVDTQSLSEGTSAKC